MPPFQQIKRLTKRSWTELQEVDDLELVDQLISGNHDAFAVIVDRYQRLVFSVALRIVKDEGEAEDVAQTVFADVFTQIGQYDAERGTLKMWLLQYAYGRSLNRRHYLRQRQFYSQGKVADDDLTTSAHSIIGARASRLSTPEVSRLVAQALGALNIKQQNAIALVYFQGLTLDEAAEKTGETRAAVRHQYYRGLMKLRDFIQSNRSLQSETADRRNVSLEVAHLKPRPI